MNDYSSVVWAGGLANQLRRRRLNRLLDRAARGDTTAFAEFYDATAGVVYSRALAAADDASHAESIVKDIYVTAWARARCFDASKASPDQWLMSIAASRSEDHIVR